MKKMFLRIVVQLFKFALVYACFQSQAFVHARVNAQLKLIEFKNDKGKDFRGNYCEGTRLGTCDTYFKMCVRLEKLSGGMSNCDYSMSRSNDIEKNNIDFQRDNTGIPKIINIRRNHWDGNISLYLEAWDDDHLSDDKIDIISYQRPSLASANGTRAVISETIYGSRASDKTQLHFNLRVYCDIHYYGDKCDTHCQPRDDSSGHFICNSKGDRVCLPNWHNLPDCKTYCQPRDDSSGHFICNSKGDRVCLPNWHNLPDCKTYCQPQNNDVNGHYLCAKNGSRICRNSWYNLPDCKTFCEPQNDRVNGHFNCSKTGGKVCHDYWHGPNCSSYCRPSASDAPGYFNCSKNGEKICAPNYFGENCTVFCLASGNSVPRYVCDSSTGAKVCRGGFFGTYCNMSISFTSYIVPLPETMVISSASGTGTLRSWTKAATSSRQTQHITVTIAATTTAATATTTAATTKATTATASPTPVIVFTASTLATSFSSVDTPLSSQRSSQRITSSFLRTSQSKTTQRDHTESVGPMLSSAVSSSNRAPAMLASSSSYLTKLSSLSTHLSTFTKKQTATQYSNLVTTPSLASSSLASEHYTVSSRKAMHSVNHTTDSARSFRTSKLEVSVTSTSRMLSQKTPSQTPTPPVTETVVPAIKPTTANTSWRRGQSKQPDWLTETKEGKTVLFGSLFAFLLLVALVVAVVLFVKSPKGGAAKQNYDEFDKLGEEKDGKGDLNMEEKSYFNPLYKVPVDVLTGQTKKRTGKLEKFYKKKDPLENHSSAVLNMSYEESSSDVVINPLYAIRGQFVANETEF